MDGGGGWLASLPPCPGSFVHPDQFSRSLCRKPTAAALRNESLGQGTWFRPRFVAEGVDDCRVHPNVGLLPRFSVHDGMLVDAHKEGHIHLLEPAFSTSAAEMGCKVVPLIGGKLRFGRF